MAVDERKRKGILGDGGSACSSWREEESAMMEQWIITVQRGGGERHHPQAENRKYRFYEGELSVTREEKRVKAQEVVDGVAFQNGEERELGEEQKKFSGYLALPVTTPKQRHTGVGMQGWALRLLVGLWCRCSSMALFCILLNGAGLGAQVGLSHLVTLASA